MYETQKVLLPSVKDRTPVQDTSKCIYEFTCICGSKYIGRTERCLSTRVREHLPKWLINSVDRTPKSSTTRYLLDSEQSMDFNNSFQVINKQSNSQLIKFAEACAIRIYRPNLCIQKEMVVNFRFTLVTFYVYTNAFIYY